MTSDEVARELLALQKEPMRTPGKEGGGGESSGTIVGGTTRRPLESEIRLERRYRAGTGSTLKTRSRLSATK